MVKKSDPLKLKIFLGEKEILLAEKKAMSSMKPDWDIEYYSKARLKDLFEEFSNDRDVKSLVLWTKRKSFHTLKQSFFSLFRIIDAAGGIVKNEKGQVLFIFRRGKWDLPKGKMVRRKAKSETAKQAATREVKEETGLKRLSVLSETAPTYHIYYIKKKAVLKHTRWFMMRSGSNEKLVPETREEITLVKWLGVKEIKKVTENTYASLRDTIRNL